MKKYLFGLTAILFAIIVVSFTTQNDEITQFSDVFFEYTAPGGSYEEVDVENPANWVEVSGDCGPCNNVNEKACRIKVNVTTVEGTAPNRTLKTSTIIVTIKNAECGRYAVVAGDVIWVCNKSC